MFKRENRNFILWSRVNCDFKLIWKLNNFKRIYLAIILVCGLLLLMSCMMSCANNETQVSGFQLTDLSGRTFGFDKPAEKIIALSPSDCEVLCAIDAGDKIIGRGTYCDFPESVKDIKDYGSGEIMNIEQIVAAKPDAVLMSKMGVRLEQVNALENSGLKVLVSQADTLEQTYTYIELLGKLTGKEDKANSLINNMKNKVSKIKNKVNSFNNEKKERIYYEVSPLSLGLWTAGNNTFMSEISNILNIENIFDDVNGWAEVSEDSIIERNPSIIVSANDLNIDEDSAIKEIESRSAWRNISAVENNKIIKIDNACLSRSGPRLVDSIEKLYEFVYEKK